jgi:WD40 repeat protein
MNREEEMMMLSATSAACRCLPRAVNARLLRYIGLTLSVLFAVSLCRLAAASQWPNIQWMRGGDALLKEVAVSGDGRVLGSVSPDGGAKIWDLDRRMLRRTCKLRSLHASCVAVSRDSKFIAFGDDFGDVTIWRLCDDVLVRRIEYSNQDVSAIAFAPDGTSIIASYYPSHTARIWRVATGALARTFDCAGNVAYSPDGARVACTALDNTVHVYRASDGALVHVLAGHTDLVRDVSFSPDGSTIASVSSDGTIRIYATTDGVLINSWTAHTGGAACVAYSPDGAGIVTGGQSDGMLRRWQVADGHKTWERAVTTSGAVAGPSFSPDGSTIWFGAADGIRACSASDGQSAGSLSVGRSGSPLAVSPDGLTMATGADDGLFLWNTVDGSLRLHVPAFGLLAVGFAPDGQTVAFAHGTNWIRVVRVSDGTTLAETLGYPARGGPIKFSPDSTQIAVAATYGITILRASDLSVVREMGDAPALDFVWSGDSATLTAIETSGKLIEFRISDGAWLKLHALSAPDLGRFTPDGSLLALVDTPNQVRVYRTSDGASLHLFGGFLGNITACVWSPDNRTLLTGDSEQYLGVWDVQTESLIRRFDAECRYFVGLHWIGDGFRFAFTRNDGSIGVADADPNLVLTRMCVADASGQAGSAVQVTAYLSSYDAGVPGQQVRVEIGASVLTGVTDSVGAVTVTYSIPSDKPVGTYPISAAFAGNASYPAAEGEGTLTVVRATTSVSVVDRTATVTENVALTAYLRRTPDNAGLAGRRVDFAIDGTPVGFGTTGTTGRADLIWVVTPGSTSRTIGAAFAGDSDNLPSSGSGALTCMVWTTRMAVFDRTQHIAGTTELKARLVRSDNTPIRNKSIRFSVDGSFVIERPTDTQGYARYPYYTVPDGDGAGNRSILAEWVGNDGYLPVSRTAVLTALPATPYLWVMSKSVRVGGVANLYAYFRRLPDYAKQTGKAVTFSIDGTSVAQVFTGTGSDAGIARFAYQTVEPAGVYVIGCAFGGDPWVDAGYGEGRLTIY